MTEAVTKLTGQALIDHVKLHNDCCSKTEMCLDAGYVNKKGRPAFVEFYEAIMEAKTDLNQIPEESQSGADWYDNLSEQDQLLYDQIEDMCPEFSKLTAEECQEFMDELFYIGITNAELFQNEYYSQYDGLNANRDFAEEFFDEMYSNTEVLERLRFAIDWDRVWDHMLSYDFNSIEFNDSTYYFRIF